MGTGLFPGDLPRDVTLVSGPKGHVRTSVSRSSTWKKSRLSGVSFRRDR